jgi:hypothetical protein
MTPFLSAICLTYARQPWLEEAIDCFLKQDYTGPKEMLIVNTFPRQKLSLVLPPTLNCEQPNIRIINLDTRPPSLGDARNLAIEAALGTHIVTWDDDDWYLPGHLSAIAKGYHEETDWVFLRQQFYLDGQRIVSIVPGSCPVFSFTKRAWKAVGGYPALGVGEDRAIVGKITSTHKGERVELRPDEITFMYRWGQGVFHMSGEGDDRPGHATAHDRIADFINHRADNGSIPTGPIELHPKAALDISKLASDYIERLHGSKKNECVIVQLGRFGDIINVLPIARHIAENYAKPKWMVSREFASVLEGVSYVEPLVVDLRNDQIKEAMSVARRDFRNVIQTQIWGLGYSTEKLCPSYNMESWRSAGLLSKFKDPTWFPWFDRRDAEREMLLRTKLSFEGKPLLLVNVTSSTSSPFPQGPDVLAKIVERWGKQFAVVNMADLKLHRIFDVLGLMDVAVCVVSIDTALLHLAAASHVPVVALTNPKPWLGTVCRCNCVKSFTYDEALADFEAVQNAIGGILRVMARPLKATVQQAPERYIIHAVERHNEGDQKEQQRRGYAQSSWDRLYEQGVMPAHYWKYSRTAQSIGDRRALPFLKDVLQNAMNQGGPDDIIMLTNDDVHLHDDLPELLRFHVAVYGACCAQRCEYIGQRVIASASPEVHARSSSPHMGRDLFAFTKRWLLAKWDEIPDFILGASDWDLCMASMIRLENGVQSNRQNLEQVIFPSELPRGYVMHQAHSPHWAAPNNVNKAASQRHNRTLFKAWAAKHMPGLKFHPGDVI